MFDHERETAIQFVGWNHFPAGSQFGSARGGGRCVRSFEASEERHDYYFGHLDAARVAFAMGRDLVLKPPQKGEPLNYLIYPYAEIDGAAVPQNEIKTKFSYTDSGA
jgi:hypothetical protein